MKYRAIFDIGGEMTVGCFDALAQIVGAAKIFKRETFWRELESIHLVVEKEATAIALREKLKENILWFHCLEENPAYYPWVFHVSNPTKLVDEKVFGNTANALPRRQALMHRFGWPVYWLSEGKGT